MLKSLLIGTLQAAFNQYLGLDPNSGHLLAPIAGKTIAVTITPFNETLYLCPQADAMHLLYDCPGAIDTQVSGSLFALGLMGLSKNPMQTIFSGQVKIEGDMRVGRKLQELFGKLEINLEPAIARYVGDKNAQVLSRFFSAGKDWSEESLETFRLNVSEFLQEESRELPPAPEMDIFYRQVDSLRADFDRLNSRVERLQSFLSKAKESPELQDTKGPQ